jgi:hypothetical protein
MWLPGHEVPPPELHSGQGFSLPTQSLFELHEAALIWGTQAFDLLQ